MMDIYYNPEAFGLEIVGEINFVDGWEYDTFCVWREKSTGRLGYGQDAGCSCNTAFDYCGVEQINWATPIEIIAAIQKAIEESYFDDRDSEQIAMRGVELTSKLVA